MHEIGFAGHFGKVCCEGEFAFGTGISEQLLHGGPGDINGGAQLGFGSGGDIIGDDIKATDEQAGGPAGTNEAGSRDADGFDGHGSTHFFFRPRMARASSGLATFEPSASMMVTARVVRVPLEA